MDQLTPYEADGVASALVSISLDMRWSLDNGDMARVQRDMARVARLVDAWRSPDAPPPERLPVEPSRLRLVS